MTNFAELGLSKPILAALEAAGITEPTEIQEATIQQTLTGRDLLASAQTGSGENGSIRFTDYRVSLRTREETESIGPGADS